MATPECSQPLPHPWPGDTHWCSRNWDALALCSLSSTRWGNQLEPWEGEAKPFQAIRGIVQGLHTFHTEASALGVLIDTVTPRGPESAQQTLPSRSGGCLNTLSKIQSPWDRGSRVKKCAPHQPITLLMAWLLTMEKA